MRLSDSQINRLHDALCGPEILDNRYLLTDVIGSGGMGVVFAATDKILQRQVAVKVLDQIKGESGFVERVTEEAQVLARLDHPGIVPVHDAGSLEDGRVFYVMKLVRGVTLEQWVLRQPSLSLKLRIFQNICDAVAFAHSVGVVHRDLTPNNVMVGDFGETFVLDWGLARNSARQSTSCNEPLSSSNSITRPGFLIGTPAFMAPEQTHASNCETTNATDVYALGAILYFLLVGKPPFAADDTPALRRKIIETLPDPLPNTIPRPLRAICGRCLEKKPLDRYLRAEDLGSDIAGFLDAEPIVAYQENFLERVIRWATKNAAILLLLLAYLLMRVVVALFVH